MGRSQVHHVQSDFLDSGTVDFYSPELTEGNRQIPTLTDAIELSSRKLELVLEAQLQILDMNLEILSSNRQPMQLET